PRRSCRGAGASARWRSRGGRGAATGVGGIIRDVFSMGARPIALLDSLRFGNLDDARTRYLVEGVVSGISGYGNAVGVPTVGGEVVFDDTYCGNPLVNVMCLGLLEADRLVLARAEGEGNLAVLLGSATGRDGIGGASVLASASFAEGDEAKRPAVQVGDPFEEKRLIEACLELIGSGLAVGVQDLGAAGLSCAASETAAKAGAGMDVDIARVARREPGMNGVEVMTSESQERMLAIVEPERLDAVLALARRWEVRATVVGRVTDTGRFRVYDGLFDAVGVPGAAPAAPVGDTPTIASADAPLLADVPVGSLGDGPLLHRPLARPTDLDAVQADDPRPHLAPRVPAGADLGPELLGLLAAPTIADKTWVSRQYDHQLFLNTVAGPGSDAAVLRVKGTAKALALSADGKGRFCRLDPRTGGRLAVLEAARNVACTGARPLALVNCLNFGNPERPGVMWQFSEVVDGASEACAALGIPVIGGNVSYYNASGEADIDPTPVMGVVGLIDDLRERPPGAVLHAGDDIHVLGALRADLGGSEWAVRNGCTGGLPPQADLDAARAVHELVAALVRESLVTGVHDVSDGGVAVALAEMAIAGGVGARVALAAADLTPAEACFAEPASVVIVAIDPARTDDLVVRADAAGVPVLRAGAAGGDRLVIEGACDVALADAEAAWRGGVPAGLRLG
ncbi:MAG: phosphoribosylformylglycinamidine synthase subunit PurL, partial [Actinomycetota bacterium]